MFLHVGQVGQVTPVDCGEAANYATTTTSTTAKYAHALRYEGTTLTGTALMLLDAYYGLDIFLSGWFIQK